MQLASTKKEVAFRGPTSSEDINAEINNSYYDMTQLFNLAAEHGLKIPANLDLLVRENHFLSQAIQQLKQDIDNWNNPGTLLHSFHSGPIGADTEYRVLTQPASSRTSKLYLLGNDGSAVIPQSLVDGITVYESTTEFTDITNIDPLYKVADENKFVIKCMGKKDNDFWQRKIYKDGTVDALYVVLHIKLPQNIINNLKVNSIYLSPAPEYAQSLLDIRYKSSNVWHRLDTYPVTDDGLGNKVPVEIPTMVREAFVFPSTDIAELLIYIKQPEWFSEGTQRLFVYGFHNIGIFLTRYQEADSTYRIQFDIPDPDNHSFASVTEVNFVQAKGGINPTDLTSYKIVTVDSIGNETGHDKEAVLPPNTKTVYIDLTLKTNKSLNVVPMLSGIKITYTQS